MKYTTTIGSYIVPRDYRDSCGEWSSNVAEADEPVPGPEWELVGTAAADGMLFWTWKRED